MDNAAAINGDPASVAVGGDSAGGNLAAAISLMARDRNGPAISFQLLVYPVTERNFGTASYRDNATGYSLTQEGMRWFWDQYLANDADAANPYAAPAQAANLSGLPPALVITAEFDPLRDEGEAYAELLRNAGVPAQATRYDGMIHGFFAMPAVLDQGRRAVDEANAALKASLALVGQA